MPQSPALPRGMKLVRIFGQWRAVWDLGDGMGWAWYRVDRDDLKRLFEDGQPKPDETFNNVQQFNQKYGNNYWGNVSEVNLNADTPWQDLKEKVYNTFGFVPGLDDPEVRRLILQGYFETWNETQFQVEYRKTDYYQNTTAQQRQWINLSEAEKQARIREEAVALASTYEDIWGQSVGLNSEEIVNAATKIASGQMLFDEWNFKQRRQARQQEGTPAYIDRQKELIEEREFGNRPENLALFAEQEWRNWVGPIEAPTGWADRWGKWLAEEKRSEADLENYLKSVAGSRWKAKPPDVTWQDWAAPYKSEIRQTLELPTLEDNDRLLRRILNQEIEGRDLNVMIREDPRFRKTQGFYEELSRAASDLGRQFGFIS